MLVLGISTDSTVNVEAVKELAIFFCLLIIIIIIFGLASLVTLTIIINNMVLLLSKAWELFYSETSTSVFLLFFFNVDMDIKFCTQ